VAVREQHNRRMPANNDLPIWVLPADATRDARLRVLALGARVFISKPLHALETMLRIWNLLETRALYKSLRELVPAENIELLRQPRTLAQQ
ncbi:two-component system response regulator, partial [Pseudomonas syringae]